MKKIQCAFASLLLLFAASSTNPVHAALPGTKVIKLTSRSQSPLAKRQFGASVAMSSAFAVVGEPAYDLGNPTPGAVHIFNAATGAFVRTIRPADGVDGDGFGSSVAIQGKYLLVGANRRMSSGLGAAYLFDVGTGKQLRKISGFDPFDYFGQSVAIHGDLLFVTAPEAFNRRGKVLVQGLYDPTITGVLKDDSAPSFSFLGSALYAYGDQIVVSSIYELYFFNRFTYQTSVSPSGISSSTAFAPSLVGSGFNILASCPLNDIAYSDGGSIHGISFSNKVMNVRPVDPTPGANRLLGRLMAMEGSTLVASAEGGAAGTSLIVHDVSSSSTLAVITPQDLATNVQHSALALSGNRLLVGSMDDDMLGTDAGVAYLIQPLPQAPGFVTLATKGDPAPGFAGITLNTMGDAVLGNQSFAITRSTLAGPGSNRNKDVGMYSEVGHKGFLDSAVKSRQNFFGTTFFGNAGSPISNDMTYTIFPCSLTGPAIDATNNMIVLADNGSSISTVIRTGTPLFGFPSITTRTVIQAAQSNSASRVAVRLDAKLAPGSTTLNNDSLIALQTHAGVNMQVVREDTDLGMDFRIAQIAPRVSFHSDAYLFSAAVTSTSDPTFNQRGLFRKAPAGGLDYLYVTDSPIPGGSGFKYSQFLGEGGSSANMCLRVTVKGTGISAANNEVILFDRGTGLTTTFQKGSSIIGRIVRVWPMGNRLLAHVTLKGPGITSANNAALYLYQEDGSFSKILQRGDSISGTDGGRINSIQRVEVANLSGHFAVLATLSAVPSASNLVLLRGDVNSGSAALIDESSLRRPALILRKGQSIANGFAGTTKLTSLTFPNNGTVDATGVGHKGLGSVVGSDGSVLLRATFSDRSTRLIRVP